MIIAQGKLLKLLNCSRQSLLTHLKREDFSDIEKVKLGNSVCYVLSNAQLETLKYEIMKTQKYYNSFKENKTSEILIKWTPTAIDCYKLNCDCSKCFLNKIIESGKCKMKDLIPLILKRLGQPSE